LRGFPRHGIGRGFKVAREEIVALLVALRCFVAGDYRADIARYHVYLRTITDGLAHTPGVRATIVGGADEDRFPVLEVALDEHSLGSTAFEITRRLKSGTPSVYVNEGRLHEGVLVLSAIGLEERLIEPLTERLRAVVSA
jgi:L-seryl-tRNA(Ser) seleniumtransferase